MALPALFAPNLLVDKDWHTEDEYFALEDQSQARWEFVPDGAPGPRLGRIRAMSGGTVDHSGIASNLITALHIAGNQMCRVFNSDLKVHTAEGRNTFPDVSVLCGAPSFYLARRDIVTNPILIAEVLSPSTEADDRAEKRLSYQTIPALQHYLLLAADQTRVELYTRGPSGGWHFEVWETQNAQIPLPALGIALALSDLYALVEFEAEAG